MELSAGIISHRGMSFTKTRSKMRLSGCMIYISGFKCTFPPKSLNNRIGEYEACFRPELSKFSRRSRLRTMKLHVNPQPIVEITAFPDKI